MEGAAAIETGIETLRYERREKREERRGRTEEEMSKEQKLQVIFISGLVILVIGVSMILAWWPDVVAFVKGFLGMAVAIGGLLMMYFAKK